MEQATIGPAAHWLVERGWDTPEAVRGLEPEEIRRALSGAPEGALEAALSVQPSEQVRSGRRRTAAYEGPTAVPALPRCAWALAAVIQDFPRWKTAADRRCS